MPVPQSIRSIADVLRSVRTLPAFLHRVESEVERHHGRDQAAQYAGNVGESIEETAAAGVDALRGGQQFFADLAHAGQRMAAPSVRVAAPFEARWFVVETTKVDGVPTVVMTSPDGPTHLTAREAVDLARALYVGVAFIGFPEPMALGACEAHDKWRASCNSCCVALRERQAAWKRERSAGAGL